jgi:Predicted membrane protein
MEKISYIFFGGLTTVVNIMVYTFLTRILHVDNIVSNCCAWIASVIFAYITNKLFVFFSDAHSFTAIFREFISFICCRIMSGAMDMSIMYIFVNVFNFNDFVIKIISNVLVVVVNYIFSKLVIFKQHKSISHN